MVMARAALRVAVLTPLARMPNLFRFSEQFNQTNWIKTRATVTANAIAAPDGTTTADKLVEDATATQTHLVSQTVTLGTGAHTLSLYAKAGERTKLRVRNSGTSYYAAYVDLATGAVTTNTAGEFTVTDVGGGWWFIRVTFAVATAGAIVHNVSLADVTDTYNGDNASGAYLWGAMLYRGTARQPYQATV